MASKYFIQKGGQTLGPMSASGLKKLAESGKLVPNDLVWKEGSKTKVRAEKVKGLSLKSPQVAAPSPAHTDDPSPVKDSASPVESEQDNSKDQRQFHYELDGAGQRPVFLSELQGLVRQGVVTKETRVWHDGMDDWTRASEIDELASSFPVAKKASLQFTADSEEWYYTHSEQQLGPVSKVRLAELASSGAIGSNNLIWKDGLDNWIPASTVKGLLPQAGPKTAPTSVAASTFCRNCGNALKPSVVACLQCGVPPAVIVVPQPIQRRSCVSSVD